MTTTTRTTLRTGRCNRNVVSSASRNVNARSLPRPSGAPLLRPPPPPPPPPGGVRLDRRRQGSRYPSSQWSVADRREVVLAAIVVTRYSLNLSWWGGWPIVAAVAAAVATVAAAGGGSRIAHGRIWQPGDAGSQRREDLLPQPVARVPRLQLDRQEVRPESSSEGEFCLLLTSPTFFFYRIVRENDKGWSQWRRRW